MIRIPDIEIPEWIVWGFLGWLGFGLTMLALTTMELLVAASSYFQSRHQQIDEKRRCKAADRRKA